MTSNIRKTTVLDVMRRLLQPKNIMVRVVVVVVEWGGVGEGKDERVGASSGWAGPAQRPCWLVRGAGPMLPGTAGCSQWAPARARA